MNVEMIGTNAGAVWTALSEAAATLDTKQIKKATKLKDKELYAALGWLAREGKVTLAPADDSKELLVTLA